MSTPLTPLPRDSFADFGPRPRDGAGPIDPDDPPWGVAAALLVWFSSVALMIFIPLLAVIPYIVVRYSGSNMSKASVALTQDPTVLLITLAATLPSHAITLGIVWAVVTGLGKRPFWKTIGWGWGERFGVWHSIVAAILLLVGGGLIAYSLGGEKTPFEEMLESSAAARFTTAALATVSAPLVEELVFRGVAYPALQRALARLINLLKPVTQGGVVNAAGGLAASASSWVNRAALAALTFFNTLDARRGGIVWAVILVSGLFLSVHVPQYANNVGVILAVGMLSVALTAVRAISGRVLPCFVIHLVFNGVQVISLVYDYFQPDKTP